MIKLIIKFLILSALLYAFLFYFGGLGGDMSSNLGYVTVNGDIYKSIGIFVGVLVGLNLVLKPILKFLTIPLNCMTMGLFSFVINFALVYLADYLVAEIALRDLYVTFGFSLAFAIAYSVVETLTDKLVG